MMGWLSGKLVTTYEDIWSYIPEDLNLHEILLQCTPSAGENAGLRFQLKFQIHKIADNLPLD
jgi:hypothetical protein